MTRMIMTVQVVTQVFITSRQVCLNCYFGFEHEVPAFVVDFSYPIDRIDSYYPSAENLVFLIRELLFVPLKKFS